MAIVDISTLTFTNQADIVEISSKDLGADSLMVAMVTLIHYSLKLEAIQFQIT